MTEAEWKCSTDSDKMLAALRGVSAGRKMRLYAVACCRRVWRLLPGERSRRAVVVAERDADGEADPEELRLAVMSAENRAEALAVSCRTAGQEAGASASFAVLNATAGKAADYAAANACSAVFHAATAANAPSAARARDAERAAQCRLLRCVFGPLPFREALIDAALRARDGGIVTKLARAAYEDRSLPAGALDNTRLAVLADALEDAGLADAELLGHLRSSGPHVRGCWALDAVLGLA